MADHILGMRDGRVGITQRCAGKGNCAICDEPGGVDRGRLKALLVKAYHVSATPVEFNLVRALWQAYGFGDPLYG